ncbi:MAG: helix-turn-helix domain-containing protein [Limisphaerales bacterium]
MNSTNATIVAFISQDFSLYAFKVSIGKISESICSQVARLLKEERKSRNISLNSLSAKAGLSRQTIAFIEQELRTPTIDTLLRITLSLEIDAKEILARAQKQSPDLSDWINKSRKTKKGSAN